MKLAEFAPVIASWLCITGGLLFDFDPAIWAATGILIISGARNIFVDVRAMRRKKH